MKMLPGEGRVGCASKAGGEGSTPKPTVHSDYPSGKNRDCCFAVYNGHNLGLYPQTQKLEFHCKIHYKLKRERTAPCTTL